MRVSPSKISCSLMALIGPLYRLITWYLRRLERRQGSARIDPDAPANEPSTKQMRISAVIAAVVPVCKWVGSVVGVAEVNGKDGTKIGVGVTAEEGEFHQELVRATALGE